MSTYAQSPDVPPPPVPPPRRRGCFFYGCLTVLTVIVLGGALVASLFYYARRDFSPIVDTYLTHVANENYQGAWDMVGPEWKKTQTFEEYAEFFKAVGGTLGPLRDKSMKGVSIQSTSTEGSIAKVNYDGTFENGAAELQFTFMKDNGSWQIEGLKYDSPLLQQLMVCASCNARQPAVNRYCASCGQRMTRVEAATPSSTDAFTTGTEMSAEASTD